jgi:hypothetical protein
MIIICCGSIHSLPWLSVKRILLEADVLPRIKARRWPALRALNRLELGNNKNTRCHKISADLEAIEDTLLLKGARCLPKDSLEVIIDLDTTDDPLPGSDDPPVWCA